MKIQKAIFTVEADTEAFKQLLAFLEQLACSEQLAFTMTTEAQADSTFQPSTNRMALAKYLLDKNDGLYQRLA